VESLGLTTSTVLSNDVAALRGAGNQIAVK
jgi:hypothetical protein